MHSLKTLLRTRRSCRKYTDEPLTKEQLTEIIHDAVWVPNGSNLQPWRFVVCTDKAKMKSYSDMAKKMWLDDWDNVPYMHQYEATFRNPDSNIFYGAPALVIIYGDTNSYWFNYDCSMVALNIHLLAEEQGLGCCWIGEAHNVFGDPSIKKELGVPENYQLVAPLILGHPGTAKRDSENPNKRKPFTIEFTE